MMFRSFISPVPPSDRTARRYASSVIDFRIAATRASTSGISIENTLLCPRYSALTLENVTVLPSPPWLQYRLEAIGLNPINNVVDVTNYVMAELAQPLHAFDWDLLRGQTIFIRPARPGERLVALNEVEYTLDASDLVIADERGAIALAGVIGGLDTCISDRTKRIVLESANFQAASIRKTSSRQKLRSSTSPAFPVAIPFLSLVLTLRVLLADDDLARAAAGSLLGLPLLSRAWACLAIGLAGGAEASYLKACLEPRKPSRTWREEVLGVGKPGRPMTAEKARDAIADYLRYDAWFSTADIVEKTTNYQGNYHTSILYRLFKPKHLRGMDDDLMQDVLVKALLKLRKKDKGLELYFERQSCREEGLPCTTSGFCCFEKWIVALKRRTVLEKQKEAPDLCRARLQPCHNASKNMRP